MNDTRPAEDKASRIFPEVAIETHPGWQKSLLDALINTSVDGLGIFDAKGFLLDFNPAFLERVLGLPRSKWVGRHVDEMVCEVVAKKKWGTARTAVRQVMEGRRPVTVLYGVEGSEIMICTVSPHLGPNGEILHIIANVRNITQLNDLKYQLEMERGHAELDDLEKLHAGCLQGRLEAVGLGDIVIESPIMHKIFSTIMQIADFETTVLLEGETGTGKGVIAKFIHRVSRRAEGPFVEVNCGALPENLVESELYGYQPGAFTGSLRSGKKGLFELAHGGTIFLDEIGELPLSSQTKLLKFLDDKAIHPIGGTSRRQVDVRIITATNRNLREMVEARQFRKDLLYRLEEIPLYVPAVRERREDLKALIYSFIDQFNRRFGVDRALGSEALCVLLGYDYPGNIRELKNLVGQLVLIAEGPEITVHDLPEHVRKSCSQAAPLLDPMERDQIPQHMDLRKELEEIERQLLTRYARQSHSTHDLARRLGVVQSTIVRKLQKYRISLNSRSSDSKPNLPGARWRQREAEGRRRRPDGLDRPAYPAAGVVDQEDRGGTAHALGADRRSHSPVADHTGAGGPAALGTR